MSSACAGDAKEKEPSGEIVDMEDTDITDDLSQDTSIGLLDLQLEAFTEMVAEDGLSIVARGLGLDRLMVNLLKLYCDPSMLVCVVNTTQEQQDFYMGQLLKAVPRHPPRIVTTEMSTQERSEAYLEAGVLFITSRILVMDILVKRIPTHLITGIVVGNAHSVSPTSTEAFILRLYRLENRAGFIKAMSDVPESMARGFNNVEKLMKSLWVRRVHLWPRFQKSIADALLRQPARVDEVYLVQTKHMFKIQQAIGELLHSSLKELKRQRPSLEMEHLSSETALLRDFDHNLSNQLDPVWHILSKGVKQLVKDIRSLRNMIKMLYHYDAVSFFHYLEAMRASSHAFNEHSHFLFLDATDDLYAAAKARVFRDPCARATKKNTSKSAAAASSSPSASGSTSGLPTRVEDVEVNPKWLAVKEVLSLLTRTPTKSGDRPKRVLICAADTSTCVQLAKVLRYGHEHVLALQLSRYYRFKSGVSNVNNASTAAASGAAPAPNAATGKTASATPTVGGSSARAAKRRRQQRRGCWGQNGDTSQGSSGAGSTGSSPTAHHVSTNTRLQRAYESIARSYVTMAPSTGPSTADGASVSGAGGAATAATDSVEPESVTDEESEQLLRESFSVGDVGDVLLFALRNEGGTRQTGATFVSALVDFQPDAIVLLDPDLVVLREVEMYVYGSSTEGAPAGSDVHVFVVFYKDSIQEQKYLTSVRVEKEAFENLIRAKQMMAVPEDQDGKKGHRQELERTTLVKPGDFAKTALGSPRRLKQPPRSLVIVDKREFRSSLPSLIHACAMDIVPITLTVGDYVLTPDTCVERKSVPDLIGSLNSGRLFTQALAMTRHYTNAVLLVEFEANRPFSLLSSGESLTDEVEFKNIMSKIALLTLSFPTLRLLWCRRPQATAHAFAALKKHQPEPDADVAASIATETTAVLDSADDGYSPGPKSFLMKLPGINTKNVRLVMEKINTLADLAAMSLQQIQGGVSGHFCLPAVLHATPYALQGVCRSNQCRWV
eukprot:m.936897 g.936897  ORF g.936897 m.936897 type:complete len:1006 (-) comp23812_c0_seq12:112-3129(-)